MPTSTFTTNTDGWTTTNGTGVHAPADGNPGGSLRGTEGGSGVWYFEAPASFLGDMSDFYGGSIAFDLRQDIETSQFDDGDVILTGGGLTLVLDFGNNPGTDWTSYSVGLGLSAGWKIGSVSGRVATEEEVRSVLGDLESFQIRGKFVSGTTGDASNLDNVAVTTAPATPADFVGVKITSTFDAGIEGWSFIEDVREFRWVPTDGNPGGYLEAVDYATGQVWYFVAPDAYLGDRSAYFGGTLAFDLRQSSTSSQFDDEDVVIQGGGLTIVLDTASNPGTDWTSYSAFLDARSDWRLASLSGAAATDAQIAQVLDDITALHIRGEFVIGSDTGGVDNVVMSPENAPVRILSNSTTGNLVSNHDTLAEALAVASAGNLIRVGTVASAALSNYSVDVNGLTILSNAALAAHLTLDGVR